MYANEIRTQEEFDQAFAAALKTAMKDKYSLVVNPELQKVLKTNGEQDAITVRFENSCIAPTLYTRQIYDDFKNGVPLEEMAGRSADVLFAAHMQSPELPQFTIEEAKKHITLTLLNTVRNTELLKQVPHTEILEGELSIVPRWYISDDASFIVTRDIARELKLTDEEVIKIGQEHIDAQKFEIKSIQQALADSIGADSVDSFPPMEAPFMVVTSETGIRGANAMLSKDTLDRVHELIGDYIVIGSSIHEFLALPKSSDMDPIEIRNIVYDINRNILSDEDFLTDCIYLYDGNSLKLIGDTLTLDEARVEGPRMEHPTMKMSF